MSWQAKRWKHCSALSSSRTHSISFQHSITPHKKKKHIKHHLTYHDPCLPHLPRPGPNFRDQRLLCVSRLAGDQGRARESILDRHLRVPPRAPPTGVRFGPGTEDGRSERRERHCHWGSRRAKNNNTFLVVWRLGLKEEPQGCHKGQHHLISPA